MIAQDQIDCLISLHKKAISKVNHDILDEFPIEYYISDVKSYSEIRNYNYISDRLRKTFDDIKSKYNDYVLASYHRLALSIFIKDSLRALRKIDIPESITKLFHEWFERVMKDFSRQPDGYYNHRKDPFKKDLGVCSLRLIPVGGAWVVEVSYHHLRPADSVRKRRLADNSRSIISAVDIRRFLRLLFIKMDIIRPFYSIHTVDRYLPRFTPKEMNRSYIRIAELLKRNPRIKGLYRNSWFLDPALEKISPHLTFLRRIPEENGAKLFRVETRQTDINNSIALSAVRKKLFEEGKYVPSCYAYFWPKKKMIEWAERYSQI